MKKAKKKLKKFNVFYIPTPAEHELIVEAYTLKEAVGKVQALMEQHCDSIKGGWEIKGSAATKFKKLIGKNK